MSDEKRPGEDRGYTPASPVKRTLAWIGLSYMVILVALTTYYFLPAPRWVTWVPC